MTFELSNAPGGLLSCREIRRRCDEEELMLDWDDEMLRPAGYNVRIAKDGLVTPKGDIYKPLALGGEDTYNGVLWLAPGDEAELSSLERFNLPPDVAGNITIRTELSAQGLLLLSGLLIDPGYGPADNDYDETISDGRLHFFVARTSVPRRFRSGPGRTALEDKAPAVARWDDPRPTSRLGFIANLKDLQEEHAKLGAEVERTRQLTLNLLVLGYFLLAATILGLTLNNLLSIGSDPSLVDRVSKAVPDSASDKLLLAAALVTVAWLVRSIVVFILGGRTPPIPEGDRFYYLRARQDLVVNRRRWRAAIMFVAGLLAFGIAWLAIEQDFAHEELLWALLATALGCGAIIADWKLVKPIDAHAVRERTDLLKELNDERAEELEKRAEKLEKRAEKLDERVEKIDERARKRDARAKKRDERAEDLETRAEELDRRAEKLDERVEKLDERARKRDARAKERHERSEQADALND